MDELDHKQYELFFDFRNWLSFSKFGDIDQK